MVVMVLVIVLNCQQSIVRKHTDRLTCTTGNRNRTSQTKFDPNEYMPIAHHALGSQKPLPQSGREALFRLTQELDLLLTQERHKIRGKEGGASVEK